MGLTGFCIYFIIESSQHASKAPVLERSREGKTGLGRYQGDPEGLL